MWPGPAHSASHQMIYPCRQLQEIFPCKETKTMPTYENGFTFTKQVLIPLSIPEFKKQKSTNFTIYS